MSARSPRGPGFLTALLQRRDMGDSTSPGMEGHASMLSSSSSCSSSSPSFWCLGRNTWLRTSQSRFAGLGRPTSPTSLATPGTPGSCGASGITTNLGEGMHGDGPILECTDRTRPSMASFMWRRFRGGCTGIWQWHRNGTLGGTTPTIRLVTSGQAALSDGERYWARCDLVPTAYAPSVTRMWCDFSSRTGRSRRLCSSMPRLWSNLPRCGSPGFSPLHETWRSFSTLELLCRYRVSGVSLRVLLHGPATLAHEAEQPSEALPTVGTAAPSAGGDHWPSSVTYGSGGAQTPQRAFCPRAPSPHDPREDWVGCGWTLLRPGAFATRSRRWRCHGSLLQPRATSSSVLEFGWPRGSTSLVGTMHRRPGMGRPFCGGGPPRVLDLLLRKRL